MVIEGYRGAPLGRPATMFKPRRGSEIDKSAMIKTEAVVERIATSYLLSTGSHKAAHETEDVITLACAQRGSTGQRT
jgi:hypothetical protein